jgi:hypothetical protein
MIFIIFCAFVGCLLSLTSKEKPVQGHVQYKLVSFLWTMLLGFCTLLGFYTPHGSYTLFSLHKLLGLVHSTWFAQTTCTLASASLNVISEAAVDNHA